VVLLSVVGLFGVFVVFFVLVLIDLGAVTLVFVWCACLLVVLWLLSACV